MTRATFNRRVEQLVEEVASHPHRRELAHLMRQQVHADTYRVKQQLHPLYGCTTMKELPHSK
jgi:hypothetical protein